MKFPDSIGVLAASRAYEAPQPDGAVRVVELRVGAPIKLEDDGPWLCPYIFDGVEGAEIHSIAGEDSMQALLLTLAYLKAEMQRLEEQRGLALRWLESPEYGFEYIKDIP